MEENRPVPLFDNFIDSEDVGQKWTEWLDEYEKYADSTEISSKGQKMMISALLFYAGQKVSRIYDTISLKDDDYDAVKEKLTTCFNPKIKEEKKQSTDARDCTELSIEVIKKDKEAKSDNQVVQSQNENPTNNNTEPTSNKKLRPFPRKTIQIQISPNNDLMKIKSAHLEV